MIQQSSLFSRQALPTLLAALSDADVCWAAALGLGSIGDASALPALTRALDDKEDTRWSAIISEDASEAIAAIQARQATP